MERAWRNSMDLRFQAQLEKYFFCQKFSPFLVNNTFLWASLLRLKKSRKKPEKERRTKNPNVI